MIIKSYNDLTPLEIDTLREIGSIGSGNAATALSQLLKREIRITLPEVRIMGYNEAIEWIGGPEAALFRSPELTQEPLSGHQYSICAPSLHSAQGS